VFAVASIRGWWRAEGQLARRAATRLRDGGAADRRNDDGKGLKSEEFAHVNLKPDKFHGEWNWTIHPRN
jgi:hypothetical protein